MRNQCNHTTARQEQKKKTARERGDVRMPPAGRGGGGGGGGAGGGGGGGGVTWPKTGEGGAGRPIRVFHPSAILEFNYEAQKEKEARKLRRQNEWRLLAVARWLHSARLCGPKDFKSSGNHAIQASRSLRRRWKPLSKHSSLVTSSQVQAPNPECAGSSVPALNDGYGTRRCTW